ncbi:hypothetical protein AB0I60_22900 [Actinosynnema sp. NPDC050436]|uniref:hypothetical protein n=1 Tax=Actinosynnema sp. NPDC050436 TaxID=3155659 RepID=UPI0033ED34FB
MAQESWLASPVVEKVLLVILGAVLGFLSSYALDRQKAKREPHRQISWEAVVEQALIEVSRDIKGKVHVTYDGTAVQALTHVTCKVVNTGNQVIKDHELRFSFPRGVRLMEHYLAPRPDPELGVEPVDVGSLDGRPQCKYRIAHLQRGEEVTFNFVTAGGELGEWQPKSFNKDDDVDFQRRDVVRVKQDQEHLQPFLVLALLAVALPPALALFDFGYFSDIGVFLVRVGLLGALIPHVRPLVRIVNGLITARLAPPAAHRGNHVSDGRFRNVVQIGGSVDGSITFYPQTADDGNETGDAAPGRVDGSRTTGES